MSFDGTELKSQRLDLSNSSGSAGGSSLQSGESSDHGAMQTNQPVPPNQAAPQEPLPPILVFQGYLKIPAQIDVTDYDTLVYPRPLTTNMVDLLLIHAHAQAYEVDPEVSSRVVVFPTVFYQHLNITEDQDATVDYQQAHSRVVQYDPELWNTVLLLIPANFGDQWILFAVTNMAQALPKTSVGPRAQTLTQGDRKPDSAPFAILAFNPQSEKTKRSLRDKIKSYLEWHYLVTKGEELEFVDSHNAKCPYQLDGVSSALHTVHHSEVLMRPGVADRVRKQAQGIRPFSRSEFNADFNQGFNSIEAYRDTQRRFVAQQMELRRALDV